MNPLLLTAGVVVASFVANFISWYLAGRRTLYVQRLEVKKACSVAFVEDLVPYLVVGGLLCVPTLPAKVAVAVSGALGGALGLGLAMIVEKRRKKEQPA